MEACVTIFLRNALLDVQRAARFTPHEENIEIHAAILSTSKRSDGLEVRASAHGAFLLLD